MCFSLEHLLICFSLYEAYCVLRMDPSNRVIYIPDCGAWGAEIGVEDQQNFFLDAVIAPFYQDEEVVLQIQTIQTAQTGETTQNFLKWLPGK